MLRRITFGTNKNSNNSSMAVSGACVQWCITILRCKKEWISEKEKKSQKLLILKLFDFFTALENWSILTLFLISGLQPAKRRTRHVSLWPFWQHRWRGAKPPRFLMYAFALALQRTLTLWLNPFQDDSCKAVFPC